MSGPIRLYHEFMKSLKQIAVKKRWGRVELMKTLALLMVGIFESRDVRLSRMAEKVPLDVQEESVVQRFRRWLKNPRVDERAIYDPVVAGLLVGLSHTRLRIQIDRTLIDDRFNILMLSVYYRKRAIPLVWQVLSHAGNSHFRERQAILEHLATLMPAGTQVIILGDREFGGADMIRSIRQQGWDYCLRVKGDLAVYLPTGHWIYLRDLAPTPGTFYYLTDVIFTRKGHVGPVHFALACDETSNDPWFIVTNLIPSRRTLHCYAQRFGCEELFSDIKARGFHLDLSQLTHPDRFSRLLLAVALLYVWVLALARQVVRQRLVKRLTYRALRHRLSFFQLGRRWLAKQLTLGKPIFPDPAFRPFCLVPK
jgi:hypothetical protein